MGGMAGGTIQSHLPPQLQEWYPQNSVRPSRSWLLWSKATAAWSNLVLLYEQQVTMDTMVGPLDHRTLVLECSRYNQAKQVSTVLVGDVTTHPCSCVETMGLLFTKTGSWGGVSEEQLVTAPLLAALHWWGSTSVPLQGQHYSFPGHCLISLQAHSQRGPSQPSKL